MRGNSRSSSFPTRTFLVIFVLLTLFNVVPPLLFPTHELSLTITAKSPSFTYQVTSYRNTFHSRCALIRCGAEKELRFEHDTTCDILFVQVKASKANQSSRLCPVDYIHSQWDTLSQTYNQGIYYLSDSVVLRVSPDKLPLDANSVHFPAARNLVDLSVAWLSVWPSNTTRAVFHDWHNAIKQTPKKHEAPEYASLNRARSCRASDVVCHPRRSSIVWQCDGARHHTSCLKKPHANRTVKTLVMAFTMVFLLTCILSTMGAVMPRLRASFSAARETSIKEVSLTPVLCIALVVVLAGEHWIVIVRTIARAVGVSFTHTLQGSHLTDADVYRAVPDLRGMYSGYAYVFRDGNDMVRISGPWISVVVNLTAAVFFLKRVLYNGLLVTCLFWIILVRLACDAILAVSGRSKARAVDEEEDDYVRRRSEIPSIVQSRGDRPRSFVTIKDRDVATAGNVKER